MKLCWCIITKMILMMMMMMIMMIKAMPAMIAKIVNTFIVSKIQSHMIEVTFVYA